MKQKKWLSHILFWLVFMSISLFNELYLSPSFSQNPTLKLFFQVFTSVLCIYLIKIIVVYTFLYLVMPIWENGRKRYQFYLLSVLVILTGTLLIRIVTQYIIWPYIVEAGSVALPMIQVTARFFYSLLDLLQIVGVAAAIKLFMLHVRSLKKEKALIQEKLSAELNHLKAQTNPHFLFNALNTIYSLSRKKSEDAPQATLQLSHILRYMLYETTQALLPISKEIGALQQYVAIQNRRFSSQHLVKFDVDIDDINTSFPPLLSFPIIENVFKHGDMNMEVDILFHIRENKFILQTKNFPGTINQTTQQHVGLGLRNLHRQLELLYKKFKLDYEKKEEQFYVNLTIDLNTYANPEMSDHRR